MDIIEDYLSQKVYKYPTKRDLAVALQIRQRKAIDRMITTCPIIGTSDVAGRHINFKDEMIEWIQRAQSFLDKHRLILAILEELRMIQKQPELGKGRE
jgi:hypothetical protein